MKELLITFSLLLFLFSCKEETKTTTNSTPTTSVSTKSVTNHLFSKKPFDLVCISRIDTTGGVKRELRKVHVDSEDLKDPTFTIELASCSYLDKKDYDKYDLPENTDYAVFGQTLKQVDIVVRVYSEKPGVAITERGFKKEGKWEYSPYKKYEIMPDGGYSMTALTMITGNH